MVDSCYVFPPGERVTDDRTGAPVLGGTVEFYDAGTTSPKTVFADADLTVPLGTTVVTDSLGYPVSGGNARTLIYVDSARYKVVIKDANGVAIVSHDNIPGAVVSASSVDVAVTALFPVVTKSLNYNVLPEDQNKTIAVNCSSADVTLTLPSAVTVGDGWKIKVQHAGSANQALLVVASGSGQTISEGSKSFGGGYALALNGEDIEISSDGGNWRVSSHTPPFICLSQGIIPITSRLATSPASPAQGALYLLTGTGGSWSGVGFAVNDIAQYTGVGWVNFTPYTDCGWTVYVADENLEYQFTDSAWVVETATSTLQGTVKVSTQAIMETGTATDAAVLVGHQKFHPAHPKAWAMFDGNPTLSIKASFGISGIVRNGTGDYTVTLSPALSSANYAVIGSAVSVADNSVNPATVFGVYNLATSTFGITLQNNDIDQAREGKIVAFAVFGDI